jgi:Ca2+-binding EF-hand superfamily protein
MRHSLITSAVIALSLTATTARAAADSNVDTLVDKIFKRVDADKDGRISRAETSARKRLAEHFDRIDADRDGFLSRDELRVVIEKRMAKKQSESSF